MQNTNTAQMPINPTTNPISRTVLVKTSLTATEAQTVAQNAINTVEADAVGYFARAKAFMGPYVPSTPSLPTLDTVKASLSSAFDSAKNFVLNHKIAGLGLAFSAWLGLAIYRVRRLKVKPELTKAENDAINQAVTAQSLSTEQAAALEAQHLAAIKAHYAASQNFFNRQNWLNSSAAVVTQLPGFASVAKTTALASHPAIVSLKDRANLHLEAVNQNRPDFKPQ